MNREEKRKIIRQYPDYDQQLEIATNLAFRNLKRMFEKSWGKDQTLNQGSVDIDENDGEDDELNY